MPPGGHHEVVAQRGLAQHGAGGLELIGHDAEIGHLASRSFQQGADDKAVGVVDGAGAQRLAGHGEFVAGEHNRHTRLAAHS